MYRKKYDSYYRIAIKKSVILTLLLIIITFLLFPVFEHPVREYQQVAFRIMVEEVPVTKQQTVRAAPRRPAVPIPSNEESIPEDETIAEINSNDLTRSATAPIGFGIVRTSAPRLLVDVFPEYPQEVYEKKITGAVKLHIQVDDKGRVSDVVVLENTTQSELCAQAAIKAAYQYRFAPARQSDRFVSSWITIVIRFIFPK